MKEINIEERISLATAFDMEDIIERYMKDYDAPLNVGKEHARELIRYLILCAIDPKKKYGMRGPVDDVWHTFLLFTYEYRQFCGLIAGRFIHHKPETRKRPPDKESYRNTFRDYEKYFGEQPPLSIWPAPIEVAGACSSSCNSCGGGCSACAGGCTGCTNCGSDCDNQ